MESRADDAGDRRTESRRWLIATIIAIAGVVVPLVIWALTPAPQPVAPAPVAMPDPAENRPADPERPGAMRKVPLRDWRPEPAGDVSADALIDIAPETERRMVAKARPR